MTYISPLPLRSSDPKFNQDLVDRAIKKYDDLWIDLTLREASLSCHSVIVATESEWRSRSIKRSLRSSAKRILAKYNQHPSIIIHPNRLLDLRATAVLSIEGYDD